MLKNHIKTTLRHLWHNRLFTTLNILGLSIGISACWIVYHIVSYELSFDKQHPAAEQVYQIVSRFKHQGNEDGFAGIPLALPPSLSNDITGLELAAPLYSRYAEKLSIPTSEGQPAKEIENARFAATLPAYFDMVPYRWLAGSKLTAIDGPDKVVLTESRAKEYFPDLVPRDLIGKTLLYDDTISRTVTGIVADLSYPSSFKDKEFIAVSPKDWASEDWQQSNTDHIVFVKVEKGKSIAPLLAFVNKKNLEYTGEAQKEYQYETWFEALPLAKKHFSEDYSAGERTVDIKVLYGLIAIGFFLLLLACINYINLSTAQMPQRAKEIGIRKTLGGTPHALIGNFFIETLAIASIALLLAVPLTNVFFALFPEFIPEGMDYFKNTFEIVVFLLLLLITITIAAGIYPSWLIIKVQTVRVLKGQAERMAPGARLSLRKALIVFQFIIAQVFIVSTLIIGQQLNYTLKKDLGFTHDAVVNVQIPYKANEGGDKDPFLYKQALKRHPEIAGIALGHEPLNNMHWGNTFFYASDTGKVQLNMPRKYIDGDYLSLYQMKLLAGTNLTPTDTLRDFVINEAARKALGFKNPEEAIGKVLTTSGNKTHPIVGVVQDFHQKSIHVEIEPIALGSSNSRSYLQIYNIKLPADRSQWKTAFALMEKEWKAIYPNAPFEYKFNDERIKGLYESEYRMSKLIGLATGVTILISCLGLFGLAALTAFQRTKEIGIRKVLGASVSGIVSLLSKDFLKLVLIALVIASPIAWWAMSRWLEDFAYRIAIEWWMFASAGLAAVVIALLTVGYQAIRAALANPVDSLRDE